MAWLGPGSPRPLSQPPGARLLQGARVSRWSPPLSSVPVSHRGPVAAGKLSHGGLVHPSSSPSPGTFPHSLLPTACSSVRARSPKTPCRVLFRSPSTEDPWPGLPEPRSERGQLVPGQVLVRRVWVGPVSNQLPGEAASALPWLSPGGRGKGDPLGFPLVSSKRHKS